MVAEEYNYNLRFAFVVGHHNFPSDLIDGLVTYIYPYQKALCVANYFVHWII